MIQELYVYRRKTGIAIQPDPDWPGMWRVHHPDGRVSDMVNLTRARDAAVSWADLQGGAQRKGVNWKLRNAPAEARPLILPGGPLLP